ncbi:hypothetical protein [Pontibacter indicus]|uniref:Uncharacterized protein n=1 Tax=Pontibacter indicus TaxID=1317125 RepID=A0A1R3XSG8_9BACT|nr:hypothetical protein [Pontibacter indicus]SIT94811.1 hypothetical protein SAMN05444128_3789 [Pontibacter indicus]
MKYINVLFLVILCFGCKSQQQNKIGAVGIKYECELATAEFDESPYTNGDKVDSAYSKFLSIKDNGVFFTSRYFNHSNSTEAFVVDSNSKQQWTYNADESINIALSDERSKVVSNLLEQVEKGSFRQVCYNGPSEGSMSLLLVKLGGELVMKYEASQFDYTHLNESEKAKIRNALELINVIKTNR